MNPKAALKRYLKEPGRLQALLDQLESRQENVFEIGEGYLAFNGDTYYHHEIMFPAGMRGFAGWIPKEGGGVGYGEAGAQLLYDRND